MNQDDIDEFFKHYKDDFNFDHEIICSPKDADSKKLQVGQRSKVI